MGPLRRTSHRITGSSFWKNIINNRAVTALMVILLVFVNIYLFTRVSYLFEPISIALGIIGPPIIVAGIFYYLLNPLIDFLEKKGLHRTTGIFLVFGFLVLLLAGGVTIIFPILREQFNSFLAEWPTYWETIRSSIDRWSQDRTIPFLPNQIEQGNFFNTLSEYLAQILSATVGGLTNVIGTVTQIVIVIFTTPFILYYLLKDGRRLPDYLLGFLPVKFREKTKTVAAEANTQLSQYIRGQLIVAFFVGLIFWIGFSIIGLDYALSLGVMAGLLNLIPYLGSILATIPAVILGLVHSPFMLLKVIIVFAVEQLLEGRVLSPQILGVNLRIHPITIIFILLVAGRLFGVSGVILGIPGYAMLKIILNHLFNWYADYSGMYEEETISDTQE